MKITCQSCQAKYTIADEKVVGKTVKIKCKKCGAAIVVNANDPSVADAHGHGQEPEEDDGATRVFSGDPATEGPAVGGGPDWTVNVADDDQRTMSGAQIAAAFAAGTITGDTYVWRDGMADWQPLSQVAELRSAMSAAPAAAAPAAHAPAAHAPPTDDDLNATVAMNPEAAAAHYAPVAAAPAAATGPTAARKAARPGQDLFGGGGGDGGGSPFEGSGGASGSVAPPKNPDHKSVGERNENSVLFSLAALTATEKAAAAPDLGPAKKKTGGRAGLDDIMNIGGGGGMGAGMLAPPPIMAPVIEPPPQQMAPPPMAAAAPMAMGGSMPPPAAAMGMGSAGMISIPPPAQKKTPVGLIVGIVVGVLALAGVGVFLATSGDKGATAENGTTADSAATTTTKPTAPTTTTASPTPTETVAANTAAATNTAAPPAGDPGSTTKSASGGTAPAGTGTGKPSGTAATAATTSQPATPPPTATATAETPPAGGGAEFNRAAASSALGGAAGAAKGCKKADGPTGTAKVKVTFAPSGNVTQSVVQGAPFAGTPVGGCIAAAFRSAKVPPFDGSPVSVTKSVTIN